MDPALLDRLDRLNRMSRNDRRALFDRHIDDGTCWACERPVAEGEPRYTITGEHWSCYEARSRTPSPAAPPHPAAPATGTYLARAAGGCLIHNVDRATGRALCGHTPRNTAWRMRPRGRWIMHLAVPSHCRRCSTCARAEAARNPATPSAN